MEREPGYYWVKYKNEWSVAEWVKGNDYSLPMWHTLYASAMLNEDSDFEEIDERRIVREPKHFENFTVSPWVPEISPLTDVEKEKFDRIVNEAIRKSILEFKPFDLKDNG